VALTTDTTYSNAYRADNLGDVKPQILIGGKTEKFVPNVNISFGLESSKEQYFLNINRASVTVDKEVSSLASDKLALSIGNETDIWHVDENGNLKWDIEFAQKPTTNKFSWDLTHTEGIEFYYQPALTQDEIDSGHKRPDNVVGSYAVYCNKSGHYKDADGKTIVNYRAGKLMHIYRPLCIDAKGNKEWAELLIENGTFTITIPQKYLDDAVYPLTLDPNVGYTSVGASGYGVEANYLYGLKASAPASSGTGDSISIHAQQYSGTPSFKGVLIDHTDSDALETNGVGNACAIGLETPDWYVSSFGTAPTISSSNAYYPSFIVSASWVSVAYDSGTSVACLDTTNSYASPAGGGWTYDTISERYSVYYTYTTGGGASPVPLFDYYFNNVRP
jgi:hypothetical protein